MEFKGTPGPWRLVYTAEHPKNNNEQMSIIQIGKHRVALLAVEDSVMDRDTLHANALLISKAPDMVSVLQGLLTEANKLTDEIGLTETFYQRFNQIEKLIKSATQS